MSDDAVPSGEPQCDEIGGELIFVYGTLKRTQINFPHWMCPTDGDGSDSTAVHCRFIGSAVTCDCFPLFVNSKKFVNCSPCLLNIPGEGYRVHGEVFWVSKSRRAHLDQLEGVASGIYLPVSIQLQWASGAAPRWWRGGDLEPLAPTRALFRATVYFRASKFDPDWKTSRKLLRTFDAASCLADEGTEYDCLPAHVRFCNLNPCCRPKPIVLVILDGLGDARTALLGGATPLADAAEKEPWLSVLARHGVSGMMDPCTPGLACGSDTAHLSMLGYNPRKYYRGRGAFESVGTGMDMTPGEDIAFKCNFAVRDMDGSAATRRVLRRRCDRDFTREGPVLCEFLDGTVVTRDVDGHVLQHGPHVVRVKYATEHRCGVVITGRCLTDRVSGTDPLTDGLDLLRCVPLACGSAEETTRAAYTSRVVEAVSDALSAKLATHTINEARRSCGKHPANLVLLRGPAMRSPLPTFEQLHGFKAFMVAPTCIIRGLGACCGIDIVESEGGTGDYHSNLLEKAKTVVRVFSAQRHLHRPYHFAVLHVKGTDDAGHDGNPRLKSELLQRCGKDVLKTLWEGLEQGSTIAVTGDHTTLCAMEDHSTEPVPFSMATIPTRYSTTHDSNFSEEACSVGSLGRFPGVHLVPTIKDYHFRACRSN